MAGQQPCYTETELTGETGHRSCPGCRRAFEPGGRGLGKQFCTDNCRRAFHQRMKAEGGPIVAMVKAWAATRHAKPGTREAEICRYARRELTALANHYNERDAQSQRASAVSYVGALMDAGALWFDRHGMG